MTDLLELAKRVEALDGPCRETDRRIMAALGFTYHSGLRSIGLTYGKAWDKHPYQEWVKGDDVVPDHSVPDYTASLDAAMTLASGMTEAQIWSIWHVALTRCSKLEDDLLKDVARYFTAAILRALAAMEGGR